MEYEKIKQLMEDMKNYDLSDLDIEFSDGTKISMKKKSEKIASVKNNEVVTKTEILEKMVLDSENQEKIKIEKGEENLENQKVIKSPIVGTFYSKPSPTANPYVEVGKEIKKGEVVCIVEAMKLMNEIESEFNGKILKVLLNDGDMVEYGTPLFVIE